MKLIKGTGYCDNKDCGSAGGYADREGEGYFISIPFYGSVSTIEFLCEACISKMMRSFEKDK